MSDIGNIVDGLIKEQKQKKAEKNAFWVQAMGEAIAEEASVKMFKEKEGSLIITCTNSCVRAELYQNKDNVLEKVNKILQKDKKRVTNIVFR
jgi:hypothetical protein